MGPQGLAGAGFSAFMTPAPDIIRLFYFFMENLFLVLFFLSVAVLIVGLINPAWLRMSSRKKASLVTGSATVLFFVLFGITAPPSESTPQVVATENSTPSTESAPVSESIASEPTPAPTVSPEEALKQSITSVANTGSFVYMGTDVEKADPDRPAGSTMITAKVNVKSFYNRNSLMRQTGDLSAKIFQAVYDSDINAADTFVYFYGETTDRYGNKKNDVVLTYGMDKATYEKINWSNFDNSTLCDFLTQEERVAGVGSGPSCTVLANIQ